MLRSRFKARPIFWTLLASGLLLTAAIFVLVVWPPRAGLWPADGADRPKASLRFEPLSAREALRIDFSPKTRWRYEDTLDRLGDAPLAEAHTRHDAIDLLDKEKTSIHPGKRMAAYLGTLHSHTGWSDGADDPKTALAFGRDVAHLDFMAITDHTEYWIYGGQEKWRATAEAAKGESRADFIALRGFEYSHPLAGHMVVLESSDYCSALRCPSIASFYRWLKEPAQKGALAIFAHPGFRKDLDDGREFAQFHFDPALKETLVAMEVIHWDGYEPFLRKKNPPSYFDRALAQGWRLGPLGSQDNHKRNWGASGQNRLGVLLEHLDQPCLITALRERRFYATSNDNLQFSFSAKIDDETWLPMGSHIPWSLIPGEDLEVEARFFDPDPWDPLRRFELVYDGQVIAALDFVEKPASPRVSPEISGPFRQRIRSGRIVGRIKLSGRERTKSHSVYARLFHRDDLGGYTQSSPLFVGEGER